MRWLKTGRQIGQAVKNVQRLRHIVAVFSKHGFVDIVSRMNLAKYLPTKLATFANSQSHRTTQERVRLAFEELGPAFVKLGQLLSTRPDIIPEEFIDEFVKLQDNVLPIPYEVIKPVIETELGKTIEEAFKSFNKTPLASASISQVHEATLHSGEAVVIKVQRPEIKKIIDQDVALLKFLSKLLEKYVPETQVVRPQIIVKEFFSTLSQELDFYIEANNMQKFAKNMSDYPEIVVPKVYKNLSTSRILTLEKLIGIRVNDIEALDRARIDKKLVIKIGTKAFFKSIMIDGLFHGDLHGGNLFVLPGNRIGIIDFGIVGRLSDKSKDQLANMVMAILTEDFEQLCYQYAELGDAPPSIDFVGFQREVRNNLSPYMGLSMSEVNSGKVLIEATKIASKYEIQVPGDWMIVFKAILTTEGMGRTLDPQFDVLEMGEEFVKEIVKNQYSVQKITKELAWVGKDAISLLQSLPRQFKWMLKKFTQDGFAFEVKIPEIKSVLSTLESHNQKSNLSLLSIGCFIAGAITLQSTSPWTILGIPAFAFIFWCIGSIFLLRLLTK